MFPHSFRRGSSFDEFRSFSMVFDDFRIPYEKNTKGETELTKGTELACWRMAASRMGQRSGCHDFAVGQQEAEGDLKLEI